MKKKKLLSIRHFVSQEFFRATLIPLLLIGLGLVLLYFKMIAYNYEESAEILRSEGKYHLGEIASVQSRMISEQLKATSALSHILQSETQDFFTNPETTPLFSTTPPTFEFASNGVYYKTENNGGSSVFYSVKTSIGSIEKEKATRSEALDPLYKHILQANENIVAVYLNTFDSMNRYYPFIDKVYKQFSHDTNFPDFNFYYLADAQNNPEKVPVWTETYLDPAGKGWMMSCVAPVYRNNFLEGVVGIDITIITFIDNVLKLELPWEAEAFLVDSKGTIMAMPAGVECLLGVSELREHIYEANVQQDTYKPKEFNLFKTNNLGVSAIIARLLDEERSVVELNIDSGSFLLAQATVAETGWKLMVLADKKEIMQAIIVQERNAKRIGYLIICGMLVFFFLFLTYLRHNAKVIAKQIAKPISTIAEKSTEIAKGKYTVAQINSPIHELNILGNNYTVMVRETEQLHKSLNNEITRANKEIKERRFAQEALQASEEKLNAIFNHTLQFMGLLAPDGTVLRINRTALNFIGIEEQDVLWKPFWETPWWSQSKKSQVVLKRAISKAAKGQPIRFETRHPDKAGQLQYIDFSINPVKDDDGNVRLLIPEGRIITELKEVEQELIRAKETAENANHAKNEFLSNIGHELRTPMHGILSYSQFGIKRIDKVPKNKLLEYFSEIEDSGQRLMILLTDLLDLAKLEAGKMSYIIKKNDMGALIYTIISELSPMSQKKRIQVSGPLLLDIRELPFDQIRIAQVLRNLFSNAISFSKPDNKIWFEINEVEEEGVLYLQVTVADQGPGIPEEEQDTIFDKFIQSSKTKTGAGGTGLGLAICKQIVEYHDGRIWAENNPEGGALFCFTLPLKPSREEQTL